MRRNETRMGHGRSMPRPNRKPARDGRRRRTHLLLPIVLLLTGCASAGHHLARPAPGSLPPNSPLLVASLADQDAWLRHHVMFGDHDQALALLGPGRRQAGADRLLRALQEAIVLREAGEFERSNERLEWADLEAERRRIRSASETLGSYIASDRVVSYTPTPGEAAMIPYYRMLNHLALGDLDAAAVEARRIGNLLEAVGADSRRCQGDAMLQYLAGLVFEAVGEGTDALVSLRRAESSFAVCSSGSGTGPPEHLGTDLLRIAFELGIEDVADGARERYASAVLPPPSRSGEVVVLLERGFVAHLSERAIHVPILEREIEDLESGDISGIAEAAALVAARLADNVIERAYWGSAWDDHPAVQVGYALSGAYILRLAWPVVVEPDRAAGSLRLVAAGDTIGIGRIGGVSEMVAGELVDGSATALTRMVGRGMVKFLATRELEKRAEKRGGELLGFVTGRLSNLAANELERADTRSWSLLPDEVAMARLTLPPGTHDLRLESISPAGTLVGYLDLGPVEVHPDELVVVSRRLWSGDEFRFPTTDAPASNEISTTSNAPPEARVPPLPLPGTTPPSLLVYPEPCPPFAACAEGHDIAP
jgi:uncharacterized protein